MSNDLIDLLRRLRMDVSALATKLNAVFASQLSEVVPVTVVLPAGFVNSSATHGLGRAYRGAVIVGQSAPLELCVLPPAAGSSSVVSIRAASAPSSAITVSLVVF